MTLLSLCKPNCYLLGNICWGPHWRDCWAELSPSYAFQSHLNLFLSFVVRKLLCQKLQCLPARGHVNRGKWEKLSCHHYLSVKIDVFPWNRKASSPQSSSSVPQRLGANSSVFYQCNMSVSLPTIQGYHVCLDEKNVASWWSPKQTTQWLLLYQLLPTTFSCSLGISVGFIQERDSIKDSRTKRI